MMPEMSGAEFFLLAVESKPSLEDRIIFMTGGSFTDSSNAFVGAHLERILYKPFDLEALSAVLARMPSLL